MPEPMAPVFLGDQATAQVCVCMLLCWGPCSGRWGYWSGLRSGRQLRTVPKLVCSLFPVRTLTGWVGDWDNSVQ